MTYIDKHNALDKTINLAKKYAQQAREDLTTLPETEYKHLLSELTDYIITRSF